MLIHDLKFTAGSSQRTQAILHQLQQAPQTFQVEGHVKRKCDKDSSTS